MLRKSHLLPFTALILSALAPSACSSENTEPQNGELDPVEQAANALGAAINGCQNSSQGVYGYVVNGAVKTLTLQTDQANGSTVVISAPGGKIAVNGNVCTSAGVALTTTSVTKIAVNGSTKDDKIILDLQPGTLGSAILAATGGVSVDLSQGGTDAFMLRGSTGADKFTFGTVKAGTDVYAEISGDKNADVKIKGASTLAVSMGVGADTFSGNPAVADITTGAGAPVVIAPLGTAVTVYGGADADTITGGAGNDTLYGGEGNDTFKTAAAADGDDVYHGDNGTDTMDYGARSANLTITIAVDANPDANDGDGTAGEKDDVTSTIENVIGGTGNDSITGNAGKNILTGGDGNDTLEGTTNTSCTGVSDGDVLNGGNGDDILKVAAANCFVTLNGGAGSDTADYGGRLVNLALSIDGVGNDGDSAYAANGATGEKGNIAADIEKVIGGDKDDTIVGSANADILVGGKGNDTISGMAGNDTLIGGAGDDVLNGGAGLDTVDYSDYIATTTLAVTLCDDPSELSGAPTVPYDAVAKKGCAAGNDGDSKATEKDQVVNIEWVKGGLGDDIITADPNGTVDVTLEGGAGKDTLTGGPGNDTLFGDDDDDTLNGLAGDDYLEGGNGTDALDCGAGDGDIGVVSGGDTTANCEL
jgi:Ca2+-binding RTX toxin-like protein